MECLLLLFIYDPKDVFLPENWTVRLPKKRYRCEYKTNQKHKNQRVTDSSWTEIMTVTGYVDSYVTIMTVDSW